jgi:DNA-binding MarR family transcriptional regulator
VLKLDFTPSEHEYIINNAGFTRRQRDIYNRLRDDYPYERQTLVKIANELYVSTATVSREIAKIRLKIIKVIK